MTRFVGDLWSLDWWKYSMRKHQGYIHSCTWITERHEPNRVHCVTGHQGKYNDVKTSELELNSILKICYSWRVYFYIKFLIKVFELISLCITKRKFSRNILLPGILTYDSDFIFLLCFSVYTGQTIDVITEITTQEVKSNGHTFQKYVSTIRNLYNS